ncbi:MAG: hypothetical protein MJB14_22560 [Spirochaetes bacterium]|nr:hypothetical protein [Spirochaetota bacterium]
MGKEISLFKTKAIEECLKNQSFSIKQKLNQIAILMRKQYQVKIDFCQIFGNRWSHFAGLTETIIPENRIHINEQFGMIIENDVFTQAQWLELIELLVQYLKINNRILNDKF